MRGSSRTTRRLSPFLDTMERARAAVCPESMRIRRWRPCGQTRPRLWEFPIGTLGSQVASVPTVGARLFNITNQQGDDIDRHRMAVANDQIQTEQQLLLAPFLQRPMGSCFPSPTKLST